MAEKTRIFALARELGWETKDLLTLCQNHGLDIKNQLTTIDHDVRDQIVDLVKKASAKSAAPAAPAVPAPKPAAPAPLAPERKMVNLDNRARAVPPRVEAKATPTPAPVPPPPAPAQPVAPPPAPAVAAQEKPTPAVEAKVVEAKAVEPKPVEQAAPVAAASQPKPVEVKPEPVAEAVPAPAAEPVPVPVPTPVSQETKPIIAEMSATKAPVAVAPAPKPAEPAPVVAAATEPAAPTPPPAPPVAPPKPAAPTVFPSMTQQPKMRNLSGPRPQPPRPAAPPAAASPPPAAASPPPVSAPPSASPPPPAPVPPAAATAKPAGPAAPTPPQRPVTPITPVSGNRPAPQPPQPQGNAPRPGVPASGGNTARPITPTAGTNNPPPRPSPGNRPSLGNRPVVGRPMGSGANPPSNPSGRPGGPAGRGDGRPQQGGPGAGGRGPNQGQTPASPAANTGRKLGDIPPELLAQMQGGGRATPPSVKEIEERMREQAAANRAPAVPGSPVPLTAPVVDDDEDERRGKPRRPGAGPAPAAGGGVAGRADRHKERTDRAKRKGGEDTRGGGRNTATMLLDDDNPRHRKDPRRKQAKLPGTLQRKGKVPISLPISVRSLSEAIGRKTGEVLFRLLGHGLPPSTNINSFVEADVAELLGLEFGIELDIKRQADIEQDLLDSHKTPDNPEDLVLRAPVVAVMGHVDHGKTSLLDKIRQEYGIRSDVVSTEAGGITQVLRAWRVSKDGRPITFLDTPGHAAFTKMRARGANVTDVAVIVVAANDGVMPQTEEAISHAKAAEVSIVVAINKVDLPDSNLRKTEQQLYGLGLIPDTMGGDVPFVLTSAKTGRGIDELLEQLAVVAELKELKSNPKKSASGTCLEAKLSEKEGVQATVLVQDGTLRPGDVVLCGASYGTVRKMYDDVGGVIESAGPSVPVRILGLDEVPNADDSFHVVPDLATAREIADERKGRNAERAQRAPAKRTLEDLKDAGITELKVILKAEARGSIEAITHELNKLVHEEVRVRVLHSAIGGITASDVQLALTSPQDTIILGFNVAPDGEAKQMADERGIEIREYNIIYKLADDIKAALEGKLKPREEVIQLGRAIVRQTFKISRVGTIAGCFVTQGVLERSAKLRVIRQGTVVFPPGERTVGFESLKRIKDDVREVREGFDCGVKIAGYDDIKIDDVIECYKIEQVKRTLKS